MSAPEQKSKRIVYVGAAVAGKETSLISVLQQTGLEVPFMASVGEHRRLGRRADGSAIDLTFSISHRRAARLYDPVADVDPTVAQEIQRLCTADGIIFVIDSQTARREANDYAFALLTRDLSLHGIDVGSKRIVFQANKRDRADIDELASLRERFATPNSSWVESVATAHQGTLDAVRALL